MSRHWHRFKHYLAHKVLHTDDTPHAIALGAAIGMFVALLPLLGIQMIVAIGLAALFRANKVVCIPMVWLTNPFTALPIYWACFAFGRYVMGSTPDEATVLSIIGEVHRSSLLEWSFWMQFFRQLAGLGLELWVGCVIVGGVSGVATYFVVRSALTSYRERRRQTLLRRRLFQATLRPGHVLRRSEPA